MPVALAFAAMVCPTLAVAQSNLAASDPMRFSVVRSVDAGCEPTCREWVAAQGFITRETLPAFRMVLASLKGRKPPVLLHSSGGNVPTAIAMGELVRRHGLDVAVAKTLLAPCEPAGLACAKPGRAPAGRGEIDEFRSRCASSCTLVLAGGVRRIVPPTAWVGVHQPTIVRTVTITRRDGRMAGGRRQATKVTHVSRLGMKTGQVDRQMERHVLGMGLDPSFVQITTATAAESLRILLRTELSSTRIATQTTSVAAYFASQDEGAKGR